MNEGKRVSLVSSSTNATSWSFTQVTSVAGVTCYNIGVIGASPALYLSGGSNSGTVDLVTDKTQPSTQWLLLSSVSVASLVG